MEGGDVAAIAAGEAAQNGASLSSVAAPLLPAVERSHTAAEPALQPPHSSCFRIYIPYMVIIRQLKSVALKMLLFAIY